METRQRVAARAVDELHTRLGVRASVAGVSPGRVNLIGEHTDYNGGLVLPAAVPCFTAVALTPRDDRRIRAVSPAFETVYEASLDLPGPLGGFGDYLVGMARSLKASRGFDAGIASTVPMSAGLSSSAALLLATARALEAAGATPPSEPLEAARAARQAENAFVGVPCGLMDQFIVACGVAGGACLLDCLDETWRVVQAELPDALWVVVASGIRRELTGGDYGSRVRASRAALERVREITSIPMEELRLLDPDLMAEACASARVDPEGARLLRHFVTENQRVLGMQEALEARDSGGAGALLSRGHWSLSRDFGVSLPVLDRFVRRCEGLSGCLGVRITGAGFGGSLVALVQEGDAGEGVAEAAREELPDGHQVLPIPGFCGGADGWKL